MATPPALTQIAFASGIDESQETEVLDPTEAFPVLRNGRQDHRGGYAKRLGFDAMALTRLDATSRSAGYKMFQHIDQLCVIDGTTLDSYSTSASRWVSRGRVPECVLDYVSLPAPNAPSSPPIDGCLCGNYYVTLIQTAALLYASVVDIRSGTVVKSPELLCAGDIGALAKYGTRVFAFGFNLGGNTITYQILDTASAATLTTGWSVTANVGTDARSATPALSACSMEDRVAIMYGNTSAGTDRATVKTISSAGILETRTINTGSVTPDSVAVQGSVADTLWAAWNQTTAVKVIGIDADNMAATLASAITVITTANACGLGHQIDVMSSATAGQGRCFVNDATSYSTYAQSFTTSVGAVVISGSVARVFNTLRRGRPFLYATRYYAVVTAALDYHAILVDLSDSTAYVRPIASLQVYGLATTYSQVTRIELDGATALCLLSEVTGAHASAVKLARVDFSSAQRFHTVTHAGKTFISGGLLSVFDGSTVTESGFLVHPPKPDTSLAGTGLTGSFRYAVVYEQVDRTGTWHASSVSEPTPLVSPANQTVTVTVRALSVSSRITATADPGVRISIYRTATGGSAPYYYLTSVTNDLAAATQTYADATADAALILNSQLYAPSLPGVDGSAQDRRAPPGLTYLASYNGMLVGAQGEDLWFSGQDVSGEGTWFSPIFQLPVSGGGPITGLAVQDGTLFIFKRRKVFAVSGEAPSDNGSVGGIGTPRQLAIDYGCIDANSIVTTTMGVFFQSERGIEILSRSGSLTWIGERVQNTLESYPVVTSAVLDTENDLVRISLTATQASGLATGAGRDIIFDLGLQTWISVDSKRGSGDAQASQDAGMALISSTWRYAWLSTAGVVYFEKLSTASDAYLDGSTWVTKGAESGWFKLSGIQGKQNLNRVLTMLRYASDHNLLVSLAYNYETTYRTARTFTRAEIAALLSAGWPITQLKHDPHDDAECMAVRVKLEDATPTGGTVGTGKGGTWLALSLDITPKPGTFEVPEGAA